MLIDNIFRFVQAGAEVSSLLGDGLTTVAVKRGLSRYSARQIPPVRARAMIESVTSAR